MNKNPARSIVVRVILIFAAISLITLADSGNAQSTVDPKLEDYLKAEQWRFQPFEPNYGLWQWTEDDDQALEAHYSFKYLFTAPDCTDKHRSKKKTIKQCIDGYWNRWDVFIAYTGEFDFYMQTRDSSPIVNRINNPTIHARRYMGEMDGGRFSTLRYLDLAFQHLSNGQTFDAETMENGAFVAQTAFLTDPNSAFFDSVSRSANFISVEARFRLGNHRNKKNPITGRCLGTKGCYDLWLRLIPWYVTDDNIVTWGPGAGRRDRIADYDRLRIIFAYNREFPKERDKSGLRALEYSLAWRIGDDLFKTDSFDFSIFLPWQIGSRRWSLPFYAQYHYGPMNNLSNYTRKQSSFGIGLRFN